MTQVRSNYAGTVELSRWLCGVVAEVKLLCLLQPEQQHQRATPTRYRPRANPTAVRSRSPHAHQQIMAPLPSGKTTGRMQQETHECSGERRQPRAAAARARSEGAPRPRCQAR